MKQDDYRKSVQAIYEAGLRRVKTTPMPKGQKFPPGTRVRIAKNLGPTMSGFPSGCNATVEYTYAHAYPTTLAFRDFYTGEIETPDPDVKHYSLNVDGIGSVAWYDEDQLTAYSFKARVGHPLRHDGKPYSKPNQLY